MWLRNRNLGHEILYGILCNMETAGDKKEKKKGRWADNLTNHQIN